MIRTAQDMLAALKRDTFCGVVLYQGPSMLDGKPVVAIANRITEASSNDKTGDMVQTFIMRSDIEPHVALKTGDDASVCGDCQHRPANDGTCYVRVFQAPLSTYRAFQRGRYAIPHVDYDPAILPDLFSGLAFRMGTYGDPAAVPYDIWFDCVRFARELTGYTHQWRNAAFNVLAMICMASVDSEEQALEAHAMGWRTFRVRASHEPKLANEFVCPASKEAGYKTNCAACGACKGLAYAGKASPVIIAHGNTAARFAA